MQKLDRMLDFSEALGACIIGAVAAIAKYFLTGPLFFFVNEDADAVFEQLTWLNTLAQLGGVFAFLAGMRWSRR